MKEIFGVDKVERGKIDWDYCKNNKLENQQ